jgi:hypothetical protein
MKGKPATGVSSKVSKPNKQSDDKSTKVIAIEEKKNIKPPASNQNKK